MSDDAAEKTFAPTPKKRRDAARKGDVLRSRELATAVTVLAGLAWLAFAGPWLFEEVRRLIITAFTFDRGSLEGRGVEATLAHIPGVFMPVVVLGLLVPATSMVAQLSFGEGRWVGENLQFKGSRINPVSGLKRMFGPQGWVEMGKGLLKVILLFSIAAGWAWGSADQIGDLGRATLDVQLSIVWYSVLTLLASLGAGLMVIAALDLPIQWSRREKKLRMSHQEMRDENKESEGSPDMRAARRQRQRDIAANAIGGSMREAQFVITNPTHFAVAMSYDPLKAAAPVVVAKGRGDKALAMREMAAELKLPVLEYPALARSIYYTTRERQVIRADLYSAVAAIVAFVLSVRRGERPPLPRIDVPMTLQFDAEGRAQS